MSLADSSVTGGDRLRRHFDELKARVTAESVQVGFFAPDQYEDGTSVPLVAATHEFGSPDRGISEAAFMRLGAHSAASKVHEHLASNRRAPSPIEAEQVGDIIGAEIQRSISDSGLVDSGLLRRSVKSKVDEGGTPGA